MKQSNDQSIFAWRGVSNKPTHLGLLAPSPSYFRDSHSIVQQRSGIQAQPYFSVTNYGVLLRAPLQKVEGKVWRAALACQSDMGARICISLKHEGGDQYSKESDSLWDVATVANPNAGLTRKMYTFGTLPFSPTFCPPWRPQKCVLHVPR
ncbi:hypothetical protein A0H81_06088 [Grifola frondosa]|uniref:Uncharacterized protein n=1 Tax=Grifola frondosa TaxID=5627 RepID=A0A1C7M9L9_GRIFR|nr:hypothetical protein A0H81_06088 [Grifola frondosa]